MSKIVRSSPYRHLFGTTAAKNEGTYEDLKLDTGGSRGIRTNGTLVAASWTVGTGSVLLHPLKSPGRIPQPRLLAATSSVTDLAWSPFHPDLLAGGGRDGATLLWRVSSPDAAPSARLDGPSRIERLFWHPVAQDVVAVAYGDRTVQLWRADTAASFVTVGGHGDVVTDLSWSYNGNIMASACKDKQLRLYDVRRKPKDAASKTAAHESSKGFNVHWLGNSDVVCTVGFDKASKRQVHAFDTRKLAAPIAVFQADASPAPFLSSYDEDLGLLYLAGRGDTAFRFLEWDGRNFHPVGDFKATTPQTSVAFFPKHLVSPKHCEIGRILKQVNTSSIETVSFRIPRVSKDDLFQEDLYPPTRAPAAALLAVDFAKGKSSTPKTISLKPSHAVSVFDVSPERGGKTPPPSASPASSSAGTLSPVASPSSPFGQRRTSPFGGSSRRSQKAALEEISGLTKRSGMLLAKAPRDNKFKKVFVRLFENELGLYKNESTAKPTQLIALLDGVVFPMVTPPAGYPFAFSVESGGQSVDLAAESSDDMEDWMRDLVQSTVDTFVQEEQSLRAMETRTHTATTVFDMEGRVEMRAPGAKAWSPFFCTLVEDTLACFRDAKSTNAAPERVYRLANCVVQAASDADFCFELTIDDEPGRAPYTRICRVESYAELERWLKVILNVSVKVFIQLEEQTAPPELEAWLHVKGKKRWCATAGAWLLVFRDREAVHGKPLDSIDLTKTNTFAPLDADGDPPGLRVGHLALHFASASDELLRDRWLVGLRKLHSAALDMYKLLELASFTAKREPPYIDHRSLKVGREMLLLQVSGRRGQFMVEQVALGAKSIRAGHAYVLDAGTRIFLFNTKGSTRIKRAKAFQLASTIRSKDRGTSGAKLINLDEGSKDTAAMDELAKALGSKGHPVGTGNAADAAAEEEARLEAVDKAFTLLRVAPEGASKLVTVHHSGSRNMQLASLDSGFCFVLDTGADLFVWRGKKASAFQKELAGKLVAKLYASGNREGKVSRETDGGETVLFRDHFADFAADLPISQKPKTVRSNVAATVAAKPVDVEAMRAAKLPDDCIDIPLDEGTTPATQMYVIDKFEKTPYPDELFGQFFARDSFLVVHTYQFKNEARQLVFFWQGRESSISEKGAAALLAVEEKAVADTRIVRVPQGKESSTFLGLFDKPIVVHKGSHRERSGATFPRVLKIGAGQAVETAPGYAFSDRSVFLCKTSAADDWVALCGARSAAQDRATAQAVFGAVKEDEIGRDRAPPQGVFASLAPGEAAPRLFAASSATGTLAMERVAVCQDELESGRVYLLEVPGVAAFVWIGANSTPYDQFNVALTAQRFAPGVPGWIVYQRRESVEFSVHFDAGWDTTAPRSEPEPAMPMDELIQDFSRGVYPYEVLLGDPLPAGVDASKLETYLATDEFARVFGMPRAEFDKVPEWKQAQLKQGVGLF